MPIAVFALLAGLSFYPALSLSESNIDNNSYKVLARKEGGFNVSSVEKLIEEGDNSIAKGNFVKAKESYDKARNISRQLLSFYRDLSGSFRGLDARIPREMDSKGRNAAAALAKANLRLAALFRKQNQPEVAVPVLVEVVKVMTPAKPQGMKAYSDLVELGFADTPYSSSIR